MRDGATFYDAPAQMAPTVVANRDVRLTRRLVGRHAST